MWMATVRFFRSVLQGPDMNTVIRAGLIAGAIGGETMILLVLVNTILLRSFASGNYLQTNPGLVAFWGIAYPLIVILVFEGGGIFSSWLCRADLRARRDALITGTIAGITIGIILEIMWMANILSLASRPVKFGSGIVAGNGNPLAVIFLLIILVVMGSILSAFGSYIYSAHLFRDTGQGTFLG
jgi:hypothetical protein